MEGEKKTEVFLSNEGRCIIFKKMHLTTTPQSTSAELMRGGSAQPEPNIEISDATISHTFQQRPSLIVQLVTVATV